MADGEAQAAAGDISGAGVAVAVGQTSGMRRGGNGGLINPPWDKASAAEAARRRWEGVSRAARLGLADAGGQIPDVNARQPLKVVRYLTEQHTLNAADPSAKGSAQSFKQVMDLAYPKPERSSGDGAGVPAGGAQLNITADALERILSALAGRGAAADE